MKRLLIGVLAFVLLFGYAYDKYHPGKKHLPRGNAAAEAIAYARKQLGTPYIWGGPTTPGTSAGFDCSGLTQAAWKAAGVTILRTSQEQWQSEKHVTRPEPGDLVFFHGYLAIGEQPPGHVGLVIGNHKMIEAYATGTNVRISTFGLPTSPPGDNQVMGYTDPIR